MALGLGVLVRCANKCTGRAKNYATNFRIFSTAGPNLRDTEKMYRRYSTNICGYKAIGVPRIASSRWSGSNCVVCTRSSDRNIRDVMSRTQETYFPQR